LVSTSLGDAYAFDGIFAATALPGVSRRSETSTKRSATASRSRLERRPSRIRPAAAQPAQDAELDSEAPNGLRGFPSAGSIALQTLTGSKSGSQPQASTTHGNQLIRQSLSPPTRPTFRRQKPQPPKQQSPRQPQRTQP